MPLTLFIIATCLFFGGLAFYGTRRTLSRPKLSTLFSSKDVRHFSPQNTLFIIGPSVNHAACRLQRRLLKPAIAALIGADVTVIEIYGEDPARRNGEPIDWLDPSLLRHAMNADEGFFIIFVNEDGKTAFRSEAPMVTADILEKSGLKIGPLNSSAARKSIVLKKLKAA